MSLDFLPDRSKQPREVGLTMMMDKGLSIRQLEDFLETSSDYTDVVKFGFGTAVVSKNLKEKIKLLKQAGIRPYFGGTLFELYYVRGQIDQFFQFVDNMNLDLIEISDGSIVLPLSLIHI